MAMNIRYDSGEQSFQERSRFLGMMDSRRLHNNSVELKGNYKSLHPAHLRSQNLSDRSEREINMDDPYQRMYTNRSLSIQKERNLNRNNLPRKPLSQFRNSRDISYQGSYDQNRGTKESLKNYQIIPPSDYSPQITPSSSAQNLSSLTYLRPEIPSKIPSTSLQITGMQRNNIVLAARLELASRKNFELKKKYKHQVNAKNQKLMEEMRYRDYKNNMIKKLNFSDRVNEFFDQHPTKRDYDRSGINSPAQLSRMITTDHQREEDAKILESLPKQEPRLFTEKLKEQELKFKEMIENKKKAGVVDPRDEQINQQKESRDNLKLIHGLNLKPFDKNEYRGSFILKPNNLIIIINN